MFARRISLYSALRTVALSHCFHLEPAPSGAVSPTPLNGEPAPLCGLRAREVTPCEPFLLSQPPVFSLAPLPCPSPLRSTDPDTNPTLAGALSASRRLTAAFSPSPTFRS